MVFLKALFIVIEVLCCLLLIGLILMQKSKSEGLGMAFGAGAGESLFGARAGNVLSKATVVLGAVFIVSTLALGVLYSQQDRSLMDQVEAQPAQPVNVAPQQPTDLLNIDVPPTEAPSVEQSAEDASSEADM